MNFTFKTEKPTGKYRSFESNINKIKLNKKEVGLIDDEKPFKIRLMIEKENISESKNPNCSWEWRTLKKEFESIEEAKSFLKNNYSKIIETFKLHFSE